MKAGPALRYRQKSAGGVGFFLPAALLGNVASVFFYLRGLWVVWVFPSLPVSVSGALSSCSAWNKTAPALTGGRASR